VRVPVTTLVQVGRRVAKDRTSDLHTLRNLLREVGHRAEPSSASRGPHGPEGT
jgi:hypothetical protein